jgi:hypothetical protein
MCIPYTTFWRSFHHCWGSCNSVAPVFVYLHHRMMPPALSLSDTISWWSDREIWGKCRESDVMVNGLFSLSFSSTARTKSTFTTGGRPLRGSCTFSHPSLNSHTHLRTIELLLACSYRSRSWRISASFMFFTFKQWITGRISHVVGLSIFLNINTAWCVNTVGMSANSVRALPQNQIRYACAPSWLQHCSCNTCKLNLFSG